MKRRTAVLVSAALMIGMPLAAMRLAPSARADDSPGANLAGINATAAATGIQVSPLTPGLVGAGNVSKGNLIEADVPYASSSTSTGPSSTGVASPAYPGDTASQLGNLFNTFTPIPAPLEKALNYPVVARSDYPAQVSVGTSGTYTPPTGSTGGLLSATSNSGPSGTVSTAALSQTTLPASLIQIGSATARAATDLGASTVKSTAHTDISRISLLGGAVVISGLSSDATASSDGTTGKQASDLKIGDVKVAGVAASIGPNGIQVGPAGGQGGPLVPAVNEVLTALQQAGIAVRTVAPDAQTDGTSAQVSSGVLEISFLDQHIPNPNGALPANTIGLDLELGGSSASADATSLPPFDSSFGGFGSGGLTGPAGGTGVTGVAPAPAGGGPSPSLAAPAQPALAASGSGPGPAPSLSQSPPSSSAGTPRLPAAAEPATLLGAPVQVTWVVVAFLLSLIAAGPLLGYANWQLLRGRKS